MRPHPRRAATDSSSPRAWATSDRNGMIGNHQNLRWQFQWRGSQLVNTRVLVWEDEYDEPQRQLGTVIMPPDPPPIMNARPEQYDIDENPVSTRYTVDGRIRVVFGAGSAWVIERVVTVSGELPR